MKVDEALIDRLAELSRLEFKAEEKEHIKQDLEKILSFMEKLNEIDTDGVEPLVYVNDAVNVCRKDEVVQEFSGDEVLKNAPVEDDQYFKVPKVIEQS